MEPEDVSYEKAEYIETVNIYVVHRYVLRFDSKIPLIRTRERNTLRGL